MTTVQELQTFEANFAELEQKREFLKMLRLLDTAPIGFFKTKSYGQYRIYLKQLAKSQYFKDKEDAEQKALRNAKLLAEAVNEAKRLADEFEEAKVAEAVGEAKRESEDVFSCPKRSCLRAAQSLSERKKRVQIACMEGKVGMHCICEEIESTPGTGRIPYPAQGTKAPCACTEQVFVGKDSEWDNSILKRIYFEKEGPFPPYTLDASQKLIGELYQRQRGTRIIWQKGGKDEFNKVWSRLMTQTTEATEIGID